MFDSLVADARYAVRRLSSTPGFTIAAAFCVALGIAANTAIFSLVDSILLRPLPGVSNPEELLEVGRTSDGEGSDTFSFPVLTALSERSETIGLAGWTFAPLAVGGVDAPEAVMGLQVTDNYFDVLGAPIQVGRGFVAGESGTGGSPAVVVISDSLWRDRWARDPQVVGSEVRINGTTATVVGVAAPEFRGSLAAIGAEAWVPFGMLAGGLADEATLSGWRNSMLVGVGRLEPDVSVELAREELSGVIAGIVATRPGELEGLGVSLHPLGALPVELAGPVSLFMAVLLVIVGLVLAVACVNVAGMVLARSLARSREVAVRLAIGAGRGRLVRQLLTESALLVALGAGVGVGVAAAAVQVFATLDLPTPPPFNLVLTPSLDVRALAYALGAAVVAVAVTGLGPAFRVSRPDLVPALRANQGSTRSGSLGRQALVASQVALTVVLVVAAGLFLRALTRAGSIDLGFDPSGVYALSLDTNLVGLEPADSRAVLDQITDSAASAPSVSAAGRTALLPLGIPSNMGFGALQVAGHEPPPGASGFPASVNIVGADYFDALRIPLLSGDDFPRDPAEGRLLAVINEHMARSFWPDGALGQQFQLGETEYVVQAVARDAKYQSLAEEAQFFVYVSDAQRSLATPYLVVRIDGPPGTALDTIRGAAQRIAPDLPILDVVALRSYSDLGLLPQRAAAAITAVMGSVVILLAAVGIYGVTAQMAQSRRAEIGVRMALGAAPAAVRALVVRQGMRAPLLGLAAGLAMAALVTRFVASFLYGVSPLDPAVFAGSSIVLSGIAILANWMPARWAAGLDPVRALRAD